MQYSLSESCIPVCIPHAVNIVSPFFSSIISLKSGKMVMCMQVMLSAIDLCAAAMVVSVHVIDLRRMAVSAINLPSSQQRGPLLIRDRPVGIVFSF